MIFADDVSELLVGSIFRSSEKIGNDSIHESGAHVEEGEKG